MKTIGRLCAYQLLIFPITGGLPLAEVAVKRRTIGGDDKADNNFTDDWTLAKQTLVVGKSQCAAFPSGH